MGRMGVEQFLDFFYNYEMNVRQRQKITLNTITDMKWCGVWVRIKNEDSPEKHFNDIFSEGINLK